MSNDNTYILHTSTCPKLRGLICACDGEERLERLSALLIAAQRYRTALMALIEFDNQPGARMNQTLERQRLLAEKVVAHSELINTTPVEVKE